jgi:hypothetical protein
VYYYLVASLPPVAWGEPPPWDPAELLFHCQGVLTPGDWRELSLIVEGRADEGTSAFAIWWCALDTQIRNALVRLRAARLHVDARLYTRTHPGYDVAAERAVIDAMGPAGPLERELAIDRARWMALDERVLGKRFELDEVLAYAARLRLLERWSRMTAEAGRARIEAFVAASIEEPTGRELSGGA